MKQVGGHRLEVAHRDRSDVVHDEVGEDAQVAEVIGHAGRPLLAESIDKAGADGGDLLLRVRSEEVVPPGDGAAIRGLALKDLVAIAELLGPSPHQVGRGDATAQALHIGKVGLVDRETVVAVDAVLHQQLPVGLGGVAVGALKNRHPLFGLVNHKVDELRGAGEVLMQGLHVRVERDKVEATVAVELRRPPQRPLVPVEAWAVAAFVRQGDQLAMGVKGPCVVEAREALGVAFLAAAQRRSSVRARVVENIHSAVGVAEEDERAARAHAALVVARLVDL